jgi:ABC-type bacteriocin/lantibiotic exporter with double-glycine peptidase domain
MVAALACHNLKKVYGRGIQSEMALDGVSLSFPAGQACLLLGPSGSGKTTLLSILGCLLSPSAGSVEIDGKPMNFTSSAALRIIARIIVRDDRLVGSQSELPDRGVRWNFVRRRQLLPRNGKEKWILGRRWRFDDDRFAPMDCAQ